MRFKQINHVGIRARDQERLGRFYADVLGLIPHPEKTNWFKVGDSDTMIHLMPMAGSAAGNDLVDCARHVCLEGESLEEAVTTLLSRGLRPFQTEIDPTKRRELSDAKDLSFGIGTVFVADPEENLIEFMQADRGIFSEVHF